MVAVYLRQNPETWLGAVEALEERILVLDGATGTAMQDAELTAEDFGGEELEGCNENLVFTRPDVIAQVHADFYEAGADIVVAHMGCTSGGTIGAETVTPLDESVGRIQEIVDSLNRIGKQRRVLQFCEVTVNESKSNHPGPPRSPASIIRRQIARRGESDVVE